VHPDVNASGQIFASRVRMNSDIWRFPTSGRPADLAKPTQITRQTAQVQTPSVSPDGEEFAYLSDSGGHSNVWVARIDGSARPRQLTNEQDPNVWVGLPLWSPAGNRIVFIKSRFGSSSHWIINPDDGSGLRLLVEGSTSAAWSPDGKWLYYQKYTGTRFSIYRIAVDGGEPEQLVRDDAAMPMVSSDARTLFFSPRTMASVNEIFKATPPDGPAKLIFRYESSRAPMYPTGHALSHDDRFIAVLLKDGATTNIWSISTNDGSVRQITNFGSQATLIGRQVSWSKDGRSVYAAVVETDADIVLLDGLLPPAARTSLSR
jgi:Tol biopolymer transport system component